MGVIHEIIIVEDIFKKVFSYLPEMKFNESDTISFKPRFSYGNEKALLAFLKSTEGESTRPYPLIWLVYPHNEKHQKTKVELKSTKLIIAVNNKNKAQLNEERIELSYKKILIPLCNNIITVLTKSNVFNIKHEFDIIKFPNYSNNNNENYTVDIWDAMQIVFSGSIIDNCVKPINF